MLTFNALLRLQFIPGHRRATAHIGDGHVDTEIVQRVPQLGRRLPQLLLGVAAGSLALFSKDPGAGNGTPSGDPPLPSAGSPDQCPLLSPAFHHQLHRPCCRMPMCDGQAPVWQVRSPRDLRRKRPLYKCRFLAICRHRNTAGIPLAAGSNPGRDIRCHPFLHLPGETAKGFMNRCLLPAPPSYGYR